MRYLLPLFLAFSYVALAATDSFDEGLKAYQAKDFSEAKDAFEQARAARPDDPSVQYNLGLAYMGLGQRGYAVAYWRRALALDSRLPAPYQALEKAEDKYHFSRLEKSPWAVFIHETFERVGWDFWLAFLALSWAFTSWLWLGYFRNRKGARLNDTEPPTPSFAAILSVVLLALSLAASIGKYLDEIKERGVVVTSAELKSAPTADGVTLQNLSEASEVLILLTQGDWVQVQNGEGAVGWIKKSDVIATTKGTAW